MFSEVLDSQQGVRVVVAHRGRGEFVDRVEQDAAVLGLEEVTDHDVHHFGAGGDDRCSMDLGNLT